MYGFVKLHNGVQKLMYHKQQCSTLTPQRVELPVKGKEILHFTDVEKSMKLPFVIYADFECLNTTIKGVKTQNSIRKKSIHKVSGFCYTIISPYYQTKTVTYRGKFAGIKFLKNLVHEAEKIQEILKIGNKEMEQLTLKQEQEFFDANLCHICLEPFVASEKNTKSISLSFYRMLSWSCSPGL